MDCDEQFGRVQEVLVCYQVWNRESFKCNDSHFYDVETFLEKLASEFERTSKLSVLGPMWVGGRGTDRLSSI